MFEYNEFIKRNIGFVSEEEQLKIRSAKVLVIGVGGMGGAALSCLARIGVENFMITDIDSFEVSNLNRQMFSMNSVMGQDKAQVAKKSLLDINPGIHCEIVSTNWVSELDQLLPQADFVINGCDDVRATIELMRKAKTYNKTVIDAFASTLPSVYVVQAGDPRPEEFLGYPTLGSVSSELSTKQLQLCANLETEYVMTHSSTAKHVVLQIAVEMLTGKRKRISFAPMVWMTGILMAYESVKIILGQTRDLVSYRGVFYNPYNAKVERPLWWPLALIKRFIIKRYLKELAK